ncbi:MAG: restriction endonuclease subunit S [Elusimicrobia bacterium]|nr:restriction endonuclease subunit S [Elusimicrobiota bacterium]
MKKTFLSELLVAERSQLSGNKLELNSGIYPVYGANGLVTYINFYEVDKPYLAVIKDGAGVGRVYKCPSKSSVLSTLQYLLPNSKIDLNYAYYWLSSLCLSKYAHGAAIPHIYYKDYKYESLLLPSLMVQKKIAERLDKVQELIAKQKEQIAKLNLLIKSRFLDMFGDPVTNLKKWEIKTLKDLGDVMSGGTPSRSIPRYFGGDINWFSAGELNSLFLDRSLETITEEGLLYSNAKLFPAGSLLIGMYDTAAFKLGILKQQAAFNQACAAIFPKVVKVVWVYYVLSLLKQEVLKFRRGIRQKNLNLQFIRNVKVPVPPLNLQTQFVNFVKSVEQQKEVFSARLSHLEVLYKSLMQEYFG